MKPYKILFLLVLLLSLLCLSAMASEEWLEGPCEVFGILADGTIVNITDGIPEEYLPDWGNINGYVPLYPRESISSAEWISEDVVPILPPESRLGDESLPIPALCATAGVALAAAFLFNRRQKALQV